VKVDPPTAVTIVPCVVRSDLGYFNRSSVEVEGKGESDQFEFIFNQITPGVLRESIGIPIRK
jgi:hypothetical protein